MEIFGAWLFIMGLILSPIIFIISCILNAKYKDDSYISETIRNISNCLQFICWLFVIGGMLLVYWF